MVMEGGAGVLSGSRLLVAPPRSSNSPLKISNPHHLPPLLLSLMPRVRVPRLSTSTRLYVRSEWSSQDFWEDPDNGYGSEYDEEEEEEEANDEEEANNNASNAKTASASASEYDELVKGWLSCVHSDCLFKFLRKKNRLQVVRFIYVDIVRCQTNFSFTLVHTAQLVAFSC